MDVLYTFYDFVIHIDLHLQEIIRLYGIWVYALLFLIVFCETGLVVTPFLPGDSLLFAAGVAAGGELLEGKMVFLLLFLAGALGDGCNYSIGRFVGPKIFAQETRFIKKKHLLYAHAFYEHHGGKAIVLARFMPIIRTFAPFVAGIALMQPAQFFFYNLTGCVLWVGGLVSAGFFLGNIPWVKAHFSLIIYAIIVVSLLPLVVGAVRARFAQK